MQYLIGIAYIDNIVESMPANVTGTTDGNTVAISSSAPTRDGYTFIGWCPATVTINSNGTDTCSESILSAGDTLTINQTSSNAFTLTAMWKDNYSINNVSTMQEFATMSAERKAKIIAGMPTDRQYQLQDVRDGKTYWIARLKDGNVWMTQALDLTLANGALLYSETSDVHTTVSWNPATTANTINFEGSTGTAVTGWSNSNDVPYSARPYYGSAGNDVYVLSCGNNNADTVTNLAGCTGTGKSETECQHYKVGVYYNFAAATATNNVAGTIGHTITNDDDYTVMPDSVCPAGWRLPHGLLAEATNGVSSPKNSEFDTLLYAYGITPLTGVVATQNVGFVGDGSTAIRTAPLYLVRSGDVYSKILDYRGMDGYLWSSTIGAANSGYRLVFSASAVFPANVDNRLAGFPVRCLLR